MIIGGILCDQQRIYKSYVFGWVISCQLYFQKKNVKEKEEWEKNKKKSVLKKINWIKKK